MSNKYDNIPEEYRPVGTWTFFGYTILFSIPLIGFICLLIKALGGGNVNVRNYARSYFCGLLIVVVIIAALAGLGVLGTLIGGLSGYIPASL